jgi:hypothetical protein
LVNLAASIGTFGWILPSIPPDFPSSQVTVDAGDVAIAGPVIQPARPVVVP